MITNLDRSGWFGASDTKYIMRPNHNTKTWMKWWDEKLGLLESDSSGSIYTRAGNLYEHPIMEAIDDKIFADGQILIEDLLLRVNYDGWKDGVIYEIKTRSVNTEWKPYENTGIPKDYWMQCQVEMYAYQTMSKKWFLPKFKKLILAEYPLHDSEYETDEPEVDPNRINYHEVKYDKSWINGEYLPTLKQLARALKKGKFPG